MSQKIVVDHNLFKLVLTHMVGNRPDGDITVIEEDAGVSFTWTSGGKPAAVGPQALPPIPDGFPWDGV